MADREDEEDDKVGYGKPPKNQRFKQGRSGNPTGRPKGAKNVANMINKVCLLRVRVKGEDGRQYVMSKIEVAVTQLMNLAAKGDIKAMRTLFGRGRTTIRGAGTDTRLGQ